MRISDWSSDVCSSDLSCTSASLAIRRRRYDDRARRCSVKNASKVCGSPADSPGASAVLARCMTLPMSATGRDDDVINLAPQSGRRSEEHTSELQSLMRISYAVFCLKQTTHQQPT